MTLRRRPGLCAGLAVVPLILSCGLSVGDGPGCRLDGPPVALPEVLDETSGLAVGIRDPSRIWSHNDAGHEPRLYALDAAGALHATVEIDQRNRDWEDIDRGRCGADGGSGAPAGPQTLPPAFGAPAMNPRPLVYRRKPQGPAPAQVRLDGAVKTAIDLGRARLVAVTAVFALCFVVLAVRLVDLTLVRPVDNTGLHARSAAPAIVERADITDRNGVLLATSLRTASLYANPRAIADAEQVARRLVAVMPDLDSRAVYAKL